MSFKRHVEYEHGQLQLDIAPLIDVVFLLLIFFMLTSQFIVQPGITIHLPKAVASDLVQRQNVVLTVTKENVLYLNDVVLTTAELSDQLADAAREDRPVLIKADRQASVGRVVEVWDACRQAGLSQVNIATDASE